MEKTNISTLIFLIIGSFILNLLSFGLIFFKGNPFIEQYIEILKKVLFVIVILLLTYFSSKLINRLINKRLKIRSGVERAPELINRLVAIVVFILGIVLILRYFQIELTPILAALGILGLAVGLALQPTLSNLFAGLQILSNKPISLGDYIEVDGFKGYVQDIGWRSTQIKTLPNNMVIIPNSMLIGSVITNNSIFTKEMSVIVEVGVDYGSDLKKVEKITLEVAREIQKKVKGAVADFEPLVRFNTFADSNIGFSVILRVKEFMYKYTIQHEFIKSLKERYDKEGIEISWPVRKIVETRSKHSKTKK